MVISSNSDKRQFADDCMKWLGMVKADLVANGLSSNDIDDRMDYVNALLAGSADETGGDLKATLAYAMKAYAMQPLPPSVEPLEAPVSPLGGRSVLDDTNSQQASNADAAALERVHDHWAEQDQFVVNEDDEDLIRELYQARLKSNKLAHTAYYSVSDHNKYGGA